MVEELPVGGGSGGGFGSEFPSEQPPSQPASNPDDDKPLKERLVSKVWGVRAKAFEELKEQISKFELNCSNDTMQEHQSLWASKYLLDSNAGALDKVLDCFLVYLDRCEQNIVKGMQLTVLTPLVEKCLGQARATIQQKSKESAILLFEVSEDFGEETQELMMKLCKDKRPKVFQMSITLLAALMLAFGVKRFNPGKYQKEIETAANSSSPAIRAEAMNCYKAIFQWAGEKVVEPIIEGLKQAQKDLLKKDFEAISAEKKQFKRKTRSEQAAAKDAAINDAIAEEEKKEEEVVDAYDFSAPKNILTQFGADWISATLAFKKWNEKKEAMDKVIEEANVPKLENGDYSALFEVLKKMAGDAHASVAQTAIKTIGVLSKGLRESFHDLAILAVPALLVKCKEKRLTEDIIEAFLNLMMCMQLSEVLEHFKEAIKKEKTAAGKQTALILVEKAIRQTYIDPLTDMKDDLMTFVMLYIEEKDVVVRDQALVIIGVVMGRLGEPAIAVFTDKLIKAKKDKALEAKETVKLSKYDKSERKAAAEAAAKKKAAAGAAKKPASKPASTAKASAQAAAAASGMDEQDDVMEPKKNSALIIEDDMVAPPKRPPPKLGQRPVKKATAAAAEDDGGDKSAAEPPKVGGGPPARLAGASKPAAGGNKGGKTISAADVKEEEIGSGLSKEEAINKVKEFYASEHIAKFEEAKWQIKVEGFQGLKSQIEELKPNAVIVEATCKFVKEQMNGWKQSNLNMMKEAIFTFQTIVANCENVNKRAVVVYTPFLGEKIGDIKMSPAIKELYTELAVFCTAKFISTHVVKQGLTTKAPNNIKEAANLLSLLVEEFGASKMAVKETVGFAVYCANHANKAVRDAAMNLFATIYKQLGDAITKFLDDIKPSTMQLIEAEFAKVTIYAKGDFKANRKAHGDDGKDEVGGGQDALKQLNDAAKEAQASMPRTDISKQLNSALMKKLSDTKWQEKVKGCEEVTRLLQGAEMRIEINGINDLMEALVKCFKDSNKAVLKQAILLMGLMAEAGGAPILKYSKKCFVPMLAFLGDKANLMRQDVIASTDKWAEAIGDHYVINYMCSYLADGNPVLREDSLKWINAHLEAIPKCDLQAAVKPLITCLSDKSGPIRTMAETAIVSVMCQTGFAPFQTGIQNLKPAIQQTVRPILDKAKQKAAALVPDLDNAGADDGAPAPKAAGASKSTAPAKKAAPSGPTLKPGLKPLAASSSKSNLNASLGGRNTALSRSTIPSKATAAAAAEEEDFVCNPGNKERRAQADLKSKWMHEEVNKLHVQQLQRASEEIFGADFAKKMWASDFKQHVKCIQKFIGMIESMPEELQEVVDIIFKWIYVKVAESSNTQFAVSVYDFYATLFDFLIQQNYIFWDHEGQVVVPMLCKESGSNNKILQAKIKQLIKMCFKLHDHRKTLLLIVKYGCSCKNMKSIAESLDEVATFLAQNGLEAISEPQVKVITKLVDSGDAGVREKALQVLSEIYKVLDEEIWNIVGNVPGKAKGLLEQRFKKLKGGLGASSSNTNLMASRGGRTQQPAASPRKKAGEEELTKSFNPKNQISTPRSGLKFQGLKKTDSSAKGSEKSLTTSFKAGQPAQKQGLTSSFRAGLSGSQSKTGLQDRNTVKVGGGFKAAVEAKNINSRGVTEIPNFHPDAQQIFRDDDEDLTADNQPHNLTNQADISAVMPENEDPEAKEQADTILRHINNLKYSGELSKRVESLIALNEIIQIVDQYEKGIQKTANDLISSYTHVLKDIFDREKSEMPLRFAKYFVTIVNKSCSCKKIMELVREQELYEMGEQLLTKLLIEDLDKLGDDKEGDFILKNLNGSMLRCLENCNKTSIFCVLFNLLRRYKDSQKHAKLPGLLIKCLLKLSKILEKVIPELENKRILIVIHLYMISIDHEKKSNNDEMGIRIVKTLVHEMVKEHKHKILKDYEIVKHHEVEDKHLQRWINIILNSFGEQPAAASQSESQSSNPEQEISQLIERMIANPQTVAQLDTFLNRNPHLNFDYYLRHQPDGVKNSIKQNLERYRASLSDSGSTPQARVNNWTEDEQPQDKPSDTQQQQPAARKFGFKSSGTAAVAGSTATQAANAAANSTNSSFRASGTGMRFSQRPATAAPTGSTGGLTKTNESSSASNNTQTQEQTSNDRVNNYASKLSSMRERFQQRKSVLQTDSKQPNSGTLSGAQKNLNTSFSAMNSSLQAKWSSVQKNAATSKENPQLAATMNVGQASRVSGGATASSDAAEALTRSGNVLASRLSGSQTAGGSASNQDLTNRLHELKAKLSNLKNNNK